MNELSLFSGAGGGLLASKLLGWRTIGYVEIDDYCQRALRARIDDGYLDPAPIFSDVREFVQSGAAREYRGFADVVTGGFPCQPFSVAGARRGKDDERNQWPATIGVIRAVRPRYAFLENVPGLVASGYFDRIIGDLTETGYDCRWRILSAAELGAPHRRDRLWIVGIQTDRDTEQQASWLSEPSAVCASISYAHGGDSHVKQKSIEKRKNSIDSARDGAHREMADAERPRLEGEQQARAASGAVDGPGDGRHRGWWEIEPDVGRVADGVAHRVDRLKALGNGQVPAVAARAWRMLAEDEANDWALEQGQSASRIV